MHARPTDLFHARLAGLPLPERVEAIVALGFAGIYLDRLGYAGKEFEAELASLLGVTPIASEDGRFAFYSLAARAAALESRYPPEELQRRYARLAEAPLLGWREGCDAEERNGAGLRWRWCRSKGAFAIVNHTTHSVRRTLRFGVQSYDAEGGALSLSGPLFADRTELSQAGVKYAREIDIPPGTHRVDFSCSAKPFVHPGRTLAFMFTDYELVEASAGE